MNRDLDGKENLQGGADLDGKLNGKSEGELDLEETLPPSASTSTTDLPFNLIPLFRNVDPAKIMAALRACEILTLPSQCILLSPGQYNDCIYIILAGTVKVHLNEADLDTDGIPIPIGQCIGEFSAIDGMPVSAQVKACDEAVVLRIPQQVFWSHLVMLPGIARNMMVSLVERTRLTNQLALEAQRRALELTHLQKELALARDLQTSMLPSERPLFGDRPEIEVAALMEPATSVGGDFFDAFFVAPNTLFLCIGDVSGHGIGAALLMARSIGLLRILANTETSPDAVLEKLNHSLAEGNESSLFVTMFCGFLDVLSGELIYSNGGHCPPLLLRGGVVGSLPLPKGMLVGVYPAIRYRTLSLHLAPGDLLLIYSDGLTEAESIEGVPFGIDGCETLLLEDPRAPLTELVDQLRHRLRGFTGSGSLVDDCTLLMLRRPPEVSLTGA